MSMSLFSRRRNSSANRNGRPALDQSTTNNAALAASQAFLSRPPSSSSLSSAAAAAALRSHTSSPEPVGSIQTKRMVRRGSISSIGSGSVMGGRGSMVGSARPTLQRRESSGSMTERTFRSPSPGRANGATSPDPRAPPVPAIPKSVSVSHHRSSSLEPPLRVTSPTQSGRAMSLDRNSMPPKASYRPKKRLSNVNEEEPERPEKDANVNFSRPRTSQPGSPTSPTADNKYTHGTGKWFSKPEVTTAPQQQGVNATALEQKIARIQAAAGQPVKRDHSVGSQQGTYLARSNHQTAPATVEMESVSVYDPSSRTFVQKLRPKAKVTQPPSPTVVQPPAPAPAPGTYDPNTRRIVPVQEQAPALEPKSLASPPVIQASPLDSRLQPPPRNPARLDTNGTSATFATPKQRSNSLDVPHGAFDGGSRGRDGSTSPSPQRSARFSATPVMPATIHNPPARDVSPAKPALKHHSPSSSIRASSPMANVPKSPASETSETASQASHDAFGIKKKKSVRVSFDEQPHAIEASTAASTPSALNSSVLDDDEDEDTMKPRPALPSFGSVRKQRTALDTDKATEAASERHELSSDHAVGGILRNAKTDDVQANETLSPSQSAKDTTHEVNENSEELSSPVAASTPARPELAADVKVDTSPEQPKVRDFATVPESSSLDDASVPAINLLPPTPGIEEEGRTLGSMSSQSPRTRSSAEIELPGGWNKDEENSVSTAPGSKDDDILDSPDEDPIIYSSPVSKSPDLAAIDEDSDNDSAEFSDAAEDLSELDNGGYASLNAIAVSPVAKPSPVSQPSEVTTSPPESPSVPKTSKKRVDDAALQNGKGSGDWSEATAYWSRLSKQQREQIEREHLSSDDEARPPRPAVRKTKKKAAATAESPKSVNNSTASAAAASPPVQAAARAAQPLQSAMKKSMRTQPESSPIENDVHMRQSMRTGGGSRMSTTLRNGPPPRSQQEPERKGSFTQKTMRPASVGSLSASAAGSASLRNRDSSSRTQPKPKPNAAPVMTARLQKELKDDSDSESSFKKKRRSTAVDNEGRYSMKRSMRGGPVQDTGPVREERPVSPTPARGKGRDSFSIRSLSPTGSLFGRKKRAEDVRQSIRGSSVDTASRKTLRNGPPAKNNTKSLRGSQSTSKFKSRFADSDDEDDGDERPRGGMFSSRFADSDDEDDGNSFIAADLTPVRGIPRRQGQNDGDSTDLSDEDETDPRKSSRTMPIVPDPADIDKAMDAARKKLGMTDRPSTQDSNQGSTLSRGSLRSSRPEPKSRADDVELTTGKKKFGFMGSILRRNRGSTTSIPQVSSPLRSQQDVPPSPGVAGSPANSNQPIGGSNSGSPAGKLAGRLSTQTRPTRLRRGDSNYSNATAPPAAGETNVNGDWPLPAVPKIPEQFSGARPNTSDGRGSNAGRAGSVRFEEPTDTATIYSQRTGKKKKFGVLRRAFRLND